MDTRFPQMGIVLTLHNAFVILCTRSSFSHLHCYELVRLNLTVSIYSYSFSRQTFSLINCYTIWILAYHNFTEHLFRERF